MISKEEVKHIAKLARLGLTEKEISKYQKELSRILDYIEKLKEVDISNVEPMSHSITVENVMRDDIEKPKNRKTKKLKNLLDLAPETKSGYLKVKKIIGTCTFFGHFNHKSKDINTITVRKIK